MKQIVLLKSIFLVFLFIVGINFLVAQNEEVIMIDQETGLECLGKLSEIKGEGIFAGYEEALAQESLNNQIRIKWEYPQQSLGGLLAILGGLFMSEGYEGEAIPGAINKINRRLNCDNSQTIKKEYNLYNSINGFENELFYYGENSEIENFGLGEIPGTNKRGILVTKNFAEKIVNKGFGLKSKCKNTEFKWKGLVIMTTLELGDLKYSKEKGETKRVSCDSFRECDKISDDLERLGCKYTLEYSKEFQGKGFPICEDVYAIIIPKLTAKLIGEERRAETIKNMKEKRGVDLKIEPWNNGELRVSATKKILGKNVRIPLLKCTQQKKCEDYGQSNIGKSNVCMTEKQIENLPEGEKKYIDKGYFCEDNKICVAYGKNPNLEIS
jgi:hypothetical protein